MADTKQGKFFSTALVPTCNNSVKFWLINHDKSGTVSLASFQCDCHIITVDLYEILFKLEARFKLRKDTTCEFRFLIF